MLSRSAYRYDQGIPMNHEELGNKHQIMIILIGLGHIYSNNGTLDKALEYFKSSIAINPYRENTNNHLIIF